MTESDARKSQKGHSKFAGRAGAEEWRPVPKKPVAPEDPGVPALRAPSQAQMPVPEMQYPLQPQHMPYPPQFAAHLQHPQHLQQQLQMQHHEQLRQARLAQLAHQAQMAHQVQHQQAQPQQAPLQQTPPQQAPPQQAPPQQAPPQQAPLQQAPPQQAPPQQAPPQQAPPQKAPSQQPPPQQAPPQQPPPQQPPPQQPPPQQPPPQQAPRQQPPPQLPPPQQPPPQQPPPQQASQQQPPPQQASPQQASQQQASQQQASQQQPATEKAPQAKPAQAKPTQAKPTQTQQLQAQQPRAQQLQVQRPQSQRPQAQPLQGQPQHAQRPHAQPPQPEQKAPSSSGSQQPAPHHTPVPRKEDAQFHSKRVDTQSKRESVFVKKDESYAGAVRKEEHLVRREEPPLKKEASSQKREETALRKENKASRREDAPGRRDSHVRREDGSSRKEERWQKRDEKSAERAQAGAEIKEAGAVKRHGKEKPSDHYKGHGPAQGTAYGEGRPGNHAGKRSTKGTRREKDSYHRDQLKSPPAPQVVNQDHEIDNLKESLSLSQVEVRQLKSQLVELRKGLDAEKAQVVAHKDEIEKLNAEIEKLKEVTPSAEKDIQTEPIPIPETTSVSVQTVPPPPPPEVKAPTKPDEVKRTGSELKNTAPKVSSIPIDEGSGSDWADYDTDEDEVSGDEYEGIDVLNEKLKTGDGGAPPPQHVSQGHKLPQIKLAGDPSGEVIQISRGGPSRGSRDLRELITPRPDGRRMDSGREGYGDGFRGRASADSRAFKKDGSRYQDNSSQSAKNRYDNKAGDSWGTGGGLRSGSARSSRANPSAWNSPAGGGQSQGR